VSPSDNISVDADRGRKSPGDAVTVRTASCRFIGGFSVSSGDASLAEDLTSGVFVDVWCHAGSFEGRSTVATWLLAIARYKALSALRRHAGHELDEKSAAEIPDSADDPEIATHSLGAVFFLHLAMLLNRQCGSISCTITKTRQKRLAKSFAFLWPR
jgi:hypothetical protein